MSAHSTHTHALWWKKKDDKDLNTWSHLSWKMTKWRRHHSRHPTMASQCTPQQAPHQVPLQYPAQQASPQVHHECFSVGMRADISPDITPHHLTSTSQQEPQQGGSLPPALLLTMVEADGWGRQDHCMGRNRQHRWHYPPSQPEWDKEGLGEGEAAASKSIQLLCGGKKSPEDVMPAPQLTFKELYACSVQKW